MNALLPTGSLGLVCARIRRKQNRAEYDTIFLTNIINIVWTRPTGGNARPLPPIADLYRTLSCRVCLFFLEKRLSELNRTTVFRHDTCDNNFHTNREREREMFYLTTHSTHFIYGYMASDIWLRTILIVRKETRCRHIGYSYRLTARVLLYAPSHRQDNTYHGLCYTSRGALAGTRNSSMGSIRTSLS